MPVHCNKKGYYFYIFFLYFDSERPFTVIKKSIIFITSFYISTVNATPVHCNKKEYIFFHNNDESAEEKRNKVWNTRRIGIRTIVVIFFFLYFNSEQVLTVTRLINEISLLKIQLCFAKSHLPFNEL